MESLFNSPPNPNDASDQPHHILEPLAFKYNYQSQYMCNMVHAMDDITYSKLAESCLVPFAVFGYGLREFTETFYVADRLILALGGEAQKEDECAGRCHGPYDGHHGGVWEGGNEHSEGCDCTSEEEEDEESYDEIAHEEGVWGGDEMDLSD
ncbi:uncharacterized protein KY384_008747 [Bacidia gigantensis]|uniref:uncharacterized protein n=1 Tax=Bacidia gigantensis TaxID=2732470 RepID=UPI001D0558F2|nr:uncharacterized protein KY384_008747 [Bacidia gigantensis]KAG8526546.1 hypothetical protein KY384_008747 [Bacidia gigantensis]